MSTARPWAGSRYGGVGDYLEWKAAIEAYHWDRLDEAYDAALALGTGPTGGMAHFYRLIEGEHTTRRRSSQTKVNDWLTIEWIAEEAGELGPLATRISHACDRIAARLGFQHGAATMVTVMAEEVDAPWAAGRWGYFVDKFPFDKVCLPAFAAHDPAYLHETTMHEYAHAIVLTLAEGKAPRWLNEAVAMVAQGGPEERARHVFSAGQVEWLDPQELDVAFITEDQGGRVQWHAYQQSALIGRYLVGLKGEQALGQLLRGFSNNSFLEEVKMRLVSQSPADEALREVYGFGERELFDLASQQLGE